MLIGAFLLSVGTFANSGEIIKDDLISSQQILRCYKFEVYITKVKNNNPTPYKTSYTEYGIYTEAGAYQRSLELFQMYPTETDSNGDGYWSLHSYNTSNLSNCFGEMPPPTFSEN